MFGVSNSEAPAYVDYNTKAPALHTENIMHN